MGIAETTAVRLLKRKQTVAMFQNLRFRRERSIRNYFLESRDDFVLFLRDRFLKMFLKKEVPTLFLNRFH